MTPARKFLLVATVGAAGVAGVLLGGQHAAGTDDYRAASQSSVSRADRLAAQLVKERAAYRKVTREVRELRRTLRHTPSVQEALTLTSIVYRIDRAALSSVAWCESTHRPHARNGQYLGIMRLGDGFRAASPFFPALDPYSPYANIMAAGAVISSQGYRQWQCRSGGRLAW